jgi:hypothetical protein
MPALTLLVIPVAASLALADTRIGHGRHAPPRAHGQLQAAVVQASQADCANAANSVAVLSSFGQLVPVGSVARGQCRLTLITGG